jgi:hypothetical protein
MIGLLRTGFLCLCAGVGFNLSQRLLDHFLDALVEHETWLAWLR